MSTLQERVEAGAHFLDQRYPGWATRAKGADMLSFSNDILCRATKIYDFSHALDAAELTPLEAMNLGLLYNESGEIEKLEELWDKQIQSRLMIYPQLNLPHNTIRQLLNVYEQLADNNSTNYFLCNFIARNQHELHLLTTIDIHEALKEACSGRQPLETIIEEMNDLSEPQLVTLYCMKRQLRLNWLHHELKRTAP